MQYQKGNFLIETILAVNVIAFLIISFSTYSLKLNYYRHKNQQEIIFAKQVVILSERLYHESDSAACFQRWREETQQLLPEAVLSFSVTSSQRKITFKIIPEDDEREMLV